MASVGRRQTSSVEERLIKDANTFDFPQAVALLEMLASPRRERIAVDECTLDTIRFSVNPRLSFAAAAIEKYVSRCHDGGRATLIVNFMGLVGANGVLPNPYAELLLSRSRRGDTAALAFLDIFHHRLLSLVYQSYKRHYLGLGAKSPEHTPAARYLYSFIGLHSTTQPQAPPTYDEITVKKRTLLHYAGLLAREVRTMSGLTSLLSLHFRVPIEGVPLTGAFYPIEPEQRTRLGKRGQNRTLGKSAIIGARYWDQEAAFELRIGPLTAEEYLRFLPDGDALRPLCQLTRFYVGNSIEFTVRLLLEPTMACLARIGVRRSNQSLTLKSAHMSAPLLGRTAWAGTPWKAREIVLKSKTLSVEDEC